MAANGFYLAEERGGRSFFCRSFLQTAYCEQNMRWFIIIAIIVEESDHVERSLTGVDNDEVTSLRHYTLGRKLMHGSQHWCNWLASALHAAVP